jgi:hypothetical protein
MFTCMEIHDVTTSSFSKKISKLELVETKFIYFGRLKARLYKSSNIIVLILFLLFLILFFFITVWVIKKSTL